MRPAPLRPSQDPFKWNQYGFTLAGPVRVPKLLNGKDKLFFMANYEAYRKRGSSTALFSLASAAIQSGDFSGISTKIYHLASDVLAADGKTITATPFPENVIPQSRISPISKQLLSFYQKPTLPGSVNNFVFRIRDNVAFQIRAEFFNISNRTCLNAPTSGKSLAAQVRNNLGFPKSGFGYVNSGSVAVAPRTGQVVARLQ